VHALPTLVTIPGLFGKPIDIWLGTILALLVVPQVLPGGCALWVY
jgi:hypothetical protein